MPTTRLLTVSRSIPCISGVCPTQLDPLDLPWRQTPPGCRPLWRQTTPDADPLDVDSHDHVTCDACWDATPPSVNIMTHTYENNTLPQTSFASGKNGVGYHDSFMYNYIILSHV